MRRPWLWVRWPLLGLWLALACNMPLARTTPSVTPPQPAPGPTATWTLTPYPTPSPTPTWPADLTQGWRWLFYGDWDAALAAFQQAYHQATTPEARAQALLGQARAQAQQGNTAAALNLLREVLAQYPMTRAAQQAYIHLAWMYFRLNRYIESAQAFDAYLQAGPTPLAAYVYEWQGDAWFNAEQYDRAAEAYRAALAADPFPPRRYGVELGLARALHRMGDYPAAHEAFRQLLEHSQGLEVAQTLYYWAQVYLSQNNPDAAYALYRRLVEQYPQSPYAYPALVTLVEANYPVSELARGLTDYYAGQYGPAIAALGRYIQQTPEHDGTPHHYRALAFRIVGDPQAAIAEWDQIIRDHVGDRWWVTAWEQKGYTQWAYLSLYDQAARTFLTFVDTYPQHPSAPDFLHYAARVRERADALDEAASLWQRLAETYPGSERAARAALLAAVTRYRLGQLDRARAALQVGLTLETASPYDRAALYLWLGKIAQARGDAQAARDAWTKASLLDPTGYYSERAEDLLHGRPAFAPPQTYDPTVDWEAERQAAARWVRETFLLPETTDLLSLGPLAYDPRWQRAQALWELGFYWPARQEVEDLRQAVADDPVQTFRLIEPLRQMGLYRSAIFAARRVLDLAGMNDFTTLTAPVYFNHVRFGLYYPELVNDAAQRYNFHPLQLYAVIRQESLFEGFIRSGAGARGLMQIIPETGAGLAQQLGWPPGYTADDLYRPVVSIRLGAAYLAQQRDAFGGDLYAALAAYNAGPGNALLWHNLSQGDPDLFLETIRFEETHRYIRHIYENYNLYLHFYAR